MRFLFLLGVLMVLPVEAMSQAVTLKIINPGNTSLVQTVVGISWGLVKKVAIVQRSTLLRISQLDTLAVKP